MVFMESCFNYEKLVYYCPSLFLQFFFFENFTNWFDLVWIQIAKVMKGLKKNRKEKKENKNRKGPRGNVLAQL
jgi:hypothetical protein